MLGEPESSMSSRKMHQDARMSASEAAFAILELLRETLLRLDIRSLLLVQRVNRSFQSIINQDLHLRQKLFFAPTSYCQALDLVYPQDMIYFRAIKGDNLMVNRLLCPRQCSDRFLVTEDNHVSINLANLRETNSRSADFEGSWRLMYVTQPQSRKPSSSLELTDIGYPPFSPHNTSNLWRITILRHT